MIEFKLNGKTVQTDVEDDTPLLWVLRDTLKLHGTKYGCGLGLCGACTVHLSGEAVRSCQTPLRAVRGRAVTTIEGLADTSSAATSNAGLHPVQQAWIEGNVPQCGYCQSGQIMSAAALLEQIPKPTDADIDSAMSGNVCRCGMYSRIRAAIHRASELKSSAPHADSLHADLTVQQFDPQALLVRSYT